MTNTLGVILKFTALLLLAACSGTVIEQNNAVLTMNDSSLANSQTADTVNKNSNAISKVALANIYALAITNYMQALHEKDQTVFDTLFFIKRNNGQPDDFPDIELPANINGTQVVLFSDEEAHSSRHSFSTTCPCINLVAWCDASRAEFIFFTFYPGFDHQYDCYSNYSFDTTSKAYKLESLRLEVLIRNKNGKADRFAIYEKGKHTGDKALR